MISLYIAAAFLAGLYVGYITKVERNLPLEEEREG